MPDGAWMREGPASDLGWQVWPRLAAELAGPRTTWMQPPPPFFKQLQDHHNRAWNQAWDPSEHGVLYNYTSCTPSKPVLRVAKVTPPCALTVALNILCFDGSPSKPREHLNHKFYKRIVPLRLKRGLNKIRRNKKNASLSTESRKVNWNLFINRIWF